MQRQSGGAPRSASTSSIPGRPTIPATGSRFPVREPARDPAPAAQRWTAGAREPDPDPSERAEDDDAVVRRPDVDALLGVRVVVVDAGGRQDATDHRDQTRRLEDAVADEQHLRGGGRVARLVLDIAVALVAQREP